MTSFQTSSFRFLLCGCAALSLSACLSTDFLDSRMERRGSEPHVAEGSAEDLLAAEGSWNIIEEDSASADPSSLHRLAKKRVDPKSMQKKTYMPQSKLAMAGHGKSDEDINYRLLRVERNVASLRNDFKKLLPPLSNLIVADRALDQTIQDIQAEKSHAYVPSDRMAGSPKPLKVAGLSSAQPPARKPVAPVKSAVQHKLVMAKASAAAKPVSSGARSVRSLRLGEHPGRTRIVLDISGPSKFRTDVDNGEKLLLVDLPGTGWSAQVSKALRHPLIAGYTVQPSSDGGTVLVLEMKKPVKVLGGSALPPNPTYNNHRVFVDVAAM